MKDIAKGIKIVKVCTCKTSSECMLSKHVQMYKPICHAPPKKKKKLTATSSLGYCIASLMDKLAPISLYSNPMGTSVTLNVWCGFVCPLQLHSPPGVNE